MGSYVRNLWYVAAWEAEVEAETRLVRTFLDQPMVIFRKASGDGYAMLADRCPHRFAPLSRGGREGDVLTCPYHGLAFDETGACVRNPFADQPPKGARVASWPALARHGLIWFWPGDPALADPERIPDFGFLEGQEVKRGLSRFAGHYELLTDNLMDLSHVEFIHRATFHPNGAAFRGRHEVEEGEAGAIWSNWRLPAVNRPPFLDCGVAEDAEVDQSLRMRWHAPASMVLDITWSSGGEPLSRIVSPHIITPETQSSSHYFWTCEPTPEAEALALAVFEDEDKPMIEAVQRNMAGEDFWDLKPLILQADAGGVYARRRLAQMLRAEAAAAF